MWTFKCLQQRGTADSECDGAGVSGLYFLRGGTPVFPTSSHTVNDFWVVTTDETLPKFEGWCILTSNEDPAKDAVRFALDVSDAGGNSVTVGSSTHFLRFPGGSGFSNEFYNTTERRNEPVCFQFCRDSGYHFFLGVLLLIGAATYISAVVRARAGHPDVAKKLCGCFLMLVACTTLSFGLLAMRRGCMSGAKEFIVIPPQLVWMLYALIYNEQSIKKSMFGISISGAICSLLTTELRDPQLWTMLGLNGMIFIWACYFQYVTVRAIKRARLLVQDDKATYDAEWDRMFAKDSAAFEKLQQVVQSSAASNITEVFQMHRKEDGTPLMVVESLDELYDGANAADPIFMSLVQRWAFDGGGMFARLQRGQDGRMQVRPAL